MKLTMKNLLLGLGSITVVAAPVAAVVACTDDEPTIDTTVPIDLTGTLNSKSSAHPVWQPLFKGISADMVFEVTISGTKLSHKVTSAEATEINKLANNDQAGFVSHIINLLTDASHDFDAVKSAFGSFTGFSFHGTAAKPADTKTVAPQGGQQPAITASLSAGVTVLKDDMSSWHALFKDPAAKHPADKTKFGFIENGKAYEFTFDLAKFTTMKDKIVAAGNSKQDADFFLMYAAAVAGSMDETTIKAALADSTKEAIIKIKFEAAAHSASHHASHLHAYAVIKNAF